VSITQHLRHPVARYALALVLVAVMTGVVALVRSVADVTNVSMLYLLVVIACAVAFGRGPAIAAAIGSFLAFNFFFVPPRYQLTVADDEEWVALGLLLLTGVITGQLAALLRERAREAERREKEATVLYDVVRWMSEPDLERALTGVAERVRAELNLAVVMVALSGEVSVRVQADAGDPLAIRLATDAADLPDTILGPAGAPSPVQRSDAGRWIRVVSPLAARRTSRTRSRRVSTVPVRAGDANSGSIILVRREGSGAFGATDDRLLSAVAQQIGQALDRLQLQRRATEAEILRRTDELRTALVNAVSHDLRTPLSSIIASAGSLLQTDVTWSEEQKQEFARAALEEARRLDRLVGNLLDASRIEAGSLRPEKGWYDLASLANEVAGRLRTVSARHKLVLDIPEGLPPLHFDYVHIDQVLTNLIENAVKHTPEGTEVALSVRLAENCVEVAVTDNGPGVPEAELPHIFKPFYQARAGHGPGTGLGLAVAKGLVEANGGQIRAENVAAGGARFVFTLPLAEQQAAVA
jgi:two-component system sensor histidine kinase KdpD